MPQAGTAPDDTATSQLLGLEWRRLFDIDWGRIVDLESLITSLLRSGMIVLLAILVYRLVKRLTQRLEREIREADPLVKRMREQRARTVASLLNNIAAVVIITGAALSVLSTALGIKIAPLLAGVGVLGLAVSFGAQSLVKDVINGIFILMEGQFGIGDVIRVGETAGMVEKITLRTTTLRDLEGVVHIIPNGEINRVSNLTKTFSRAVLDIRVAYREDVDRVIGVLRDIGARLHADPEWRPLLIEEPEVLGIQMFSESAVIIRVVVKTLPLKQWDVARELRRRIKKRFDEERIEIPFPHLTFYWGVGQQALAQAPSGDPTRSGQRDA